MISTSSTLLILCTVLVLLPTQAHAFGAGEIPDFAYLNDKAFRHGDIENVLAELAKSAAAGGVAGGSLLGFAQSIIGAATGGSKFSKEDVKKVYFGNWLRDYSQAMDIAGLSKLTSDTLVLIVSILGFLTFGFATEEYQVTPDRLGVYLPVEHIDNPKGYGEKEGDPRRFHPKLRPPVNPEELEIDRRTGMKNYMATEGRGWDTSTAHVRRIFKACIEYGRRAQGREGADLWEAFRLLGTGLHTMEDLLAHSNWCEIALRKMGHEQVFCHVGENVIINTPNGPAPPLVTGTFGSADFLHSLMGEATDHLSQASVVDLSKNLANASQGGGDSSLLRSLLEKLPIGGSHDEDKVSQADDMQEQAKAYQFNPDDIMPPEVQDQLLQLLKWRDDIYRDILKKIEMIPGLESLIDGITNALNAFVYTILAPYLTPVLQQVTAVLSEGSKAVIDSDDQYEVFDNPDASDPSHSLLSKDHFSLILNEPAGKTALVVVRYTVKLIVDAWYNHEETPDRVIDRILEAFHHPYFNVGRSRIQQEMFEEMERWIGSLGPEESERIVAALSKESVRAGKNKRQGADDDIASSEQVYGQVHGEAAHGAYAQGGYGGGGRDTPGSYGQGRSQQQSYGAAGGGYASADPQGADGAYSARAEAGEPAYGRSYGSGRRTEAYGADDGAQRESRYTAGNAYRDDEARGDSGSYGYNQGSGAYAAPRRTEPYAQGGGGYAPSYQPAYVQPAEDDSARDTYGASGYGGTGARRGTAEYAREEREDGGFGSYTTESSGYAAARPDAYAREAGYGRRDDAYGRDGGYRREERAGYGADEGARRNGDSEGYRGGGYGESEGRGYGGGYRESEGRGGGYGESESRAYGSSYGEGERRGGYGESESRGGDYGQTNYGGEQYGGGYGQSESRGYGYGGGNSDETFGAERLNLNDDEERPRHHHHHHHREEDEY
ncbi:heterokaryon incompatibility protein Het-C domain-containing protein [Phanerochaete sordida]|uniref:Heterokaryon incompatibility protein Het-C domain-containing protein n=1 Tax=Phanerochaete sordida TaxID=48140 RepID=A0A9P3L983_9APHY|nr:heterokaryon incompatibility protein Het-C domain-containing protein [Phanerochaete sordida]